MSEFPAPLDHECLPCYIYRASASLPCIATLRLVTHYRDQCASRATALEHKLRLLGGYCDCEVLMNTVMPTSGAVARRMDAGDDLVCQGVRRGTIQPCNNWMMKRGRQWGGGQFRRRAA